MDQAALGKLFYQEILKINRSNASYTQQFLGTYTLFTKLVDFLIQEEQFTFTSVFAQVAYISHKKQLSPELQYYLHQFRKVRTQQQVFSEEQSFLGIKATTLFIATTLKTPILPELTPITESPWPIPFQPFKTVQFIPQLRVLIVEDDPSKQLLVGKTDLAPDQEIKIRYGLAEKNELFDASIEAIKEWIGFPVTMNLLEVSVDEEGIHYPNAFILEPDFLIDISSISESFRGSNPSLSSYFLKKFWPFTTTIPLMLGNASNYFLDKLVFNTSEPYRKLFTELFKIYPLQFSLFTDGHIADLYRKAQGHYMRLKKVIQEDLPKENIDLNDGLIEPSFYSERYGIQGRLDLFIKGDTYRIIELKSGKIYRPNNYQLGQNHFVQTLLYDLLIQSVFGKKQDTINYILYSGADINQLRFAPRIKAQQWEALAFRNQIIVLEKRLSQIFPSPAGLLKGFETFRLLTLKLNLQLSSFEKNRIATFEGLFKKMPLSEQCYFLAFVGFIAREHQWAKTGIPGHEKRNGQAALWQENTISKIDKFEILNHLQLISFSDHNEDQHVILNKTQQTSALANFRTGDIVVLYPNLNEAPGVLHQQIFKGSIIELGQEKVIIRLKSKQHNTHHFGSQTLWNIEHDMLDSSFTNMYRSLYSWMEASAEKRALLLGVRPPQHHSASIDFNYPQLTEEQNKILRKMVVAKDYFLLWGPPGTGKTSIMVKYFVQYLLDHTDEQILLLGYTNRAVDEMCASIESIRPEMANAYFRIGSTYSTHEQFRSKLLGQKIKSIHTRKELVELIQSYRIVTGTIASVINKPELFTLKKFDTVVIDEASQILEPYLVGLLPTFKRFILIGDHKQLPAVVLQKDKETKVTDPRLLDFGLTDLSNALFERLYKIGIANNWHWAFDQLKHQGRMHQDIMQFPSAHFYEGQLHILPANIDHSKKQTAPFSFESIEDENKIISALRTERMIFFDAPIDEVSSQLKTNFYEAQMIVQIIQYLKLIRLSNGATLKPTEIGVITPYRAQIAMIKQQFENEDSFAKEITVDTVERYQGGAKNIILISLCTNQVDQVAMLTSISDDGVDRKLNVALTRARQQIIIIGNANLLTQLPLYKRLIENACFIPEGTWNEAGILSKPMPT